MALDFVTLPSGVKALRQDVGTEDNGKVLTVTEGKIGLTTAALAAVVDLSTAQTITGVKTFSAVPQITAGDATTDNGAVRKHQLDDAVTVGGDCSGTVGNLSVNTLFGGDTLADSVAALVPGGDVSGTIATVSVDKIKGVGLGTTTATNGNVLVADGTSWGTSTLSGAGIAAATHNHAASDINSSTLAHERGGLEADISAWNGMPVIESGATRQVKIGGDEGIHVPGIAKAIYSFADHGGVVGTIGLGVTLPAGAVVTKVLNLQIDAFTSGGAATVEWGFTGTTAAFVSQAAFDNAKFTEALHDGVPDWTAATAVEAGAKEIAITIGTADLTAGEADLIVYFFID